MCDIRLQFCTPHSLELQSTAPKGVFDWSSAGFRMLIPEELG